MSEWTGHFSKYVIEKAKDLEVIEGAVTRDENQPTVFRVKGSNRDKPYRVQLGEGWASCTCKNGQIKGGWPKCYHLAAALIASGERLD